MTKEDILHHFQDINFYYGDCMMYADLSGMLDELIAENKGEWIPITYRPMTDEEKEYYSEQAGCDKEDLDTMLNCQLPDDGEEVLITVFGEVETDIFYRDVDGCSFENRDIEDVTAWMSKPEPYKQREVSE